MEQVTNEKKILRILVKQNLNGNIAYTYMPPFPFRNLKTFLLPGWQKFLHGEGMDLLECPNIINFFNKGNLEYLTYSTVN